MSNSGLWKVVLIYRDSAYRRRIMDTHLTYEQASAMCRDKEGSSDTCTKPHLKRRTRERGAWALHMYKM